MQIGKNIIYFAFAIKIAFVLLNLWLYGSATETAQGVSTLGLITSIVSFSLFHFMTFLGIPTPISAVVQTFVSLALFLYFRSLGFGTISSLLFTTTLS